MIYGKCDYRMAIKVVFPLCSSFFTLLLYNLDQVETCFAKYTNYNTFSPIKVIYFFQYLNPKQTNFLSIQVNLWYPVL